jgi:hypothetical protein
MKMVEVSPGSRWKDAVLTYGAGFGIQSDGSLWWWNTSVRSRQDESTSPRPSRVDDESDWESFGVGGSSSPILRKIDGSYWMKPGDAWGRVAREAAGRSWIRIGDRSDWKHMVYIYPEFDMIRADGSRWRAKAGRYDATTNTLLFRERRVGHRNDWVSIGFGDGLTADGKVWDWDTARWGYYDRDAMLIPPRFRSKVIADLAAPNH